MGWEGIAWAAGPFLATWAFAVPDPGGFAGNWLILAPEWLEGSPGQQSITGRCLVSTASRSILEQIPNSCHNKLLDQPKSKDQILRFGLGVAFRLRWNRSSGANAS